MWHRLAGFIPAFSVSLLLSTIAQAQAPAPPEAAPEGSPPVPSTEPPPTPSESTGTSEGTPQGQSTDAPSTQPGQAREAPAPAPDEGDEETFVVHASRPTDMQQFATESLQELRVGRVKSRYALNVFGDVSFGLGSRTEGASRSDPAFAVGVFDLLFTADLASQLEATSEVSFQYEPNNPLAELERLHIRWRANKYFWVEAGRFHTDIGYWNVAYHHGKWLQLTVERPRVIRLHGGLLPAHWIGAQSGVSIPVGPGRIEASAAVGSARDPLGSSAHEAHGTAFSPVNGVHAKVESVGLLMRDLRFGVTGVYDRIRGEAAFVRPGLPDESIDEYVGGAHIAYPGASLTLLTEGYLIQHKIPSSHQNSKELGSKWRTYGVFGLVGYTFGKVTPYVRVEYINSIRNTLLPNPFYIPEPAARVDPTVSLDVLEYLAGARVDVSTWSALKMEYRLTTGVGTRRDDLPTPAIHTGTISWSFGI